MTTKPVSVPLDAQIPVVLPARAWQQVLAILPDGPKRVVDPIMDAIGAQIREFATKDQREVEMENAEAK